MTAIAYRDGAMAADSRVSYSNMEIKTSENKIQRIGGWLVGIAGTLSDWESIREWAFDIDGNLCEGIGRHPEKGADFVVLIVSRHRIMYVLDHTGDLTPMRAEFMAVGSGALACLGAMERGATAEEAVAAACKWAADCEGPVQVERVDDNE